MVFFYIKGVVTNLFNKVAATRIWPERWNVEHSFVLKKVPTTETLDDTRSISRSPYLSTKFEKIVVDWLLEIVGP